MFGPGLDLAEVREYVQAVRDIESRLDEFFTVRLTLRLLITHVHSLDRASSSKLVATDEAKDMIGVVNVNTQPIEILSKAYRAAHYMCQRDFDIAPDMRLNGVWHDDYMMQELDAE